jgi:hypothetical protein
MSWLRVETGLLDESPKASAMYILPRMYEILETMKFVRVVGEKRERAVGISFDTYMAQMIGLCAYIHATAIDAFIHK